MNRDENTTRPSPSTSRAGVNPWLIAVVVAVATFMEVLDTTIANVALPYIAGGLGVSDDQASWVVTTYLVSNAVALTASAFLGQWLGRRTFFLICLALFTASSVACGFAWDLNSLILFRILQGLGGGGMVPVSQSVLADSFPPEKRGQAFGLFGVAVVVAPAIGPTLGGWVSDNWSWHWCFIINGPIGVIAFVLIAAILVQPRFVVTENRRILRSAGGFDLVGFVLIAVFLGTLEVILDRGQVDDWFGSSFIIRVTGVCLVAFAVMVPWELTRRNPMIDIRMIASRQFGACFLVMSATGAILLATTQLLPLLVQLQFGYTAVWAGLVLSPGGLVTMGMMLIVGSLSSKVQPKYLITAGALIAALSMYQLTNVYSDANFWFFALSRMLLGVGLPLIFIPILAASYDGIPARKTDQASALLNAARNTGGSIGISLVSNVLAHRGQFHQARLVEQVLPPDPSYQHTVDQLVQHFLTNGSSVLAAHQQALAWIGQKITEQAALLAYADAFWTLMILSLSAVPLALTLRATGQRSDSVN